MTSPNPASKRRRFFLQKRDAANSRHDPAWRSPRPRATIGLLLPALALTLGLAPGCRGPTRPPPPSLFYEGLPVAGSLADARKAGFTDCRPDNIETRCRKAGVMFLGHGPFNAALDLVGSDGAGGFDELTLWHDWDQNALFAIAATLEQQGWRTCYTGEGSKGDQAIYTRQGMPVRVSMDLSYFGKRRLRIIPGWNRREPLC